MPKILKDGEQRVQLWCRVSPRTMESLRNMGMTNLGRAIDRLVDENEKRAALGVRANKSLPSRRGSKA